MAFAIFSYATSSVATAFHYSAAFSPLSANAAAVSPSCRSSSSSTQLDAAANNFSELDKLRAKRLNLRRPSPPSAAVIDHHDAAAHSEQQGLEYLYDQRQERHDDDFFHVILMPSTFTKKQVSIEQATNALLATLSSSSSLLSTNTIINNNNNILTFEKAHSLSLFAKHQGFSLIGTWTREDCLLIGEMLQKEGLDCRVIPYSEGLLWNSSPSPAVVVVASTSSEEEVVERISSSSSLPSSSSDYLLSLSHR